VKACVSAVQSEREKPNRPKQARPQAATTSNDVKCEESNEVLISNKRIKRELLEESPESAVDQIVSSYCLDLLLGQLNPVTSD
jgi:hypothetical protein